MPAVTLPLFISRFSFRTRLLRLTLLLTTLSYVGCGSDGSEVPAKPQLGDRCVGDDPDECDAGLVCEPLADGDARVCSEPLVIMGSLRDALDGEPVAEALVFILDETGTPVAQAVTDSTGDYTATVSVRRAANGALLEDSTWTLSASAQGYQPFPYGVRAAVPVTANQAERAAGRVLLDDDNTDVVLLPLRNADGLVTVRGTVTAQAAGALVVAESESVSPAPFGLVGPDGAFTIFNVHEGDVVIRAYRKGINVEPKAIDVDADLDAVALTLSEAKLGSVSGSINIVNAPGGSLSSVVLVPQSVFDPVSEKGPVPLGMRVPDPPKSPDVTGSFEFETVSPGNYIALAAFENDGLVRDPDTNIGGTSLQAVEVASSLVELGESFKVTAALAVGSPGADGVEEVSGPLAFAWADDSSEDSYHFVLRSALGETVWEVDVPGVSGSDTVDLDYEGPDLTPGMFYQFQATSMRDTKDGMVPISRTEDLRGVFRIK